MYAPDLLRPGASFRVINRCEVIDVLASFVVMKSNYCLIIFSVW